MRRVMGILFSFCFLLLVFTITATAGKIGELVIEHDMVITEDTTWTGKDVIINEGVTLRVKHSILTIEEGNVVNRGSIIVENANLVHRSKESMYIYNYGMLDLKSSIVDFVVYLYQDSMLLARNSKLEQIYFRGDYADVEVSDCEINRLSPQFNVMVKVTGASKINILDICIRIADNANVTYVNNKFTEESQGYIVPNVALSFISELNVFGFSMRIGKSAKATIKKSQLLWITGLQNSDVTIEDCRVMDYVKSIKGIIHLINTRVADTFYKDRTLTEGEKLP